jgi:D-arabinose 1-dehydrogenase-like Zn-dependent alcohol dehydrogenase
LATVTSGKAMSAVIPSQAVRDRLVVIGGGMDPIEVSPLDLIGGSRTVTGHASGTSIDSQNTLAFSALAGVRRNCPEIGGIMINAIRPVGYVAGWGFADGMDAAIGWNGD